MRPRRWVSLRHRRRKRYRRSLASPLVTLPLSGLFSANGVDKFCERGRQERPEGLDSFASARLCRDVAGWADDRHSPHCRSQK
jgi:hypothetical protein